VPSANSSQHAPIIYYLSSSRPSNGVLAYGWRTRRESCLIRSKISLYVPLLLFCSTLTAKKVNAIYCNALDRLSHHEPTVEMLNNLAPFLVSVFRAEHIPDPALGPSSFENFWRATYHGKHLEAMYPDDIKNCLQSLSLAWGGSLAGDLTITSDSQQVGPAIYLFLFPLSRSGLVCVNSVRFPGDPA
jgi:hypothetical protein